MQSSVTSTLQGRESEGNSSTEKRGPGRPRSEQSRQSILRSTLKLLEKTSFGDLSIEAIAADADVGKATVYRWWPDKGSLVADAFISSAGEELRFPDTGMVRQDMAAQMKQLIKIFRSRRGKIVVGLIAGGQSQPELLKAFRDRFLRPRREEAYQTLRRGISRGELPPGLDLDATLDALYGPIYMRFLLRHDHLNEAFVDQLCSTVFDGVAQR